MSGLDLTLQGSDDLPELVARMRRDLDELKGRQFVGADSFQSYGFSYPDSWDFSSTLSQGERSRWVITLNFTQANGGAVAKLNAFYRVDNDDVMADPMPRQSQINPHIDVKWLKMVDAPTYAQWELIVVNTSAVAATYTGYVKVFLTATADGTFTIVPG